MTTAFIGEIRAFSFTYAPQGWIDCDGRLLSIAQFAELFAVIGTNFGGNGTSTFGVPDFRGRAAVGFGQGPGLSDYDLGQQEGSENVLLTQTEMPTHTHTIYTDFEAYRQAPTSFVNIPTTTCYPSRYLKPQSGTTTETFEAFSNSTASQTQFNPQTLGPAGSSIGHENRQPFVTIRYCICTRGGDFPVHS